jgi:dipeptidyl aminopeptidase/acylaminoacyl peptidase
VTDFFADPARFVDLPRITDLALSADGTRLVATVSAPDLKRAKYVSSLWEIPLDGGECVRLTGSDQGESTPRFLPDGRLLFVSSRPRPDSTEDEPALWQLPVHGEAQLVLERPGGVGAPVVARGSGAVVLTGSRLAGSDDHDHDHDTDGERRQQRKDRKITAILHTGMPIRYWDHELGAEFPRLLHFPAVDTAAPCAPNDLAPDATHELIETSYSIADDGASVVATW